MFWFLELPNIPRFLFIAKIMATPFFKMIQAMQIILKSQAEKIACRKSKSIGENVNKKTSWNYLL